MVHPLVSGEDPDDLALPAPASAVPHAGVDPGAAGPWLSVAALVQEVVGFVRGLAEAVHQLTRPVVIEAGELHTLPGELLGRGADAQLHVPPLVGLLQLQQGVVVIHADVVGRALDY